MAKIPLEDTFSDIIGKAQRGLKMPDAELAKLAEVSLSDLAKIKKGEVIDVVIRSVSRHLKLNPILVEELAHKKWYPDKPTFPHGFAMFNTPHEDMTVNSYIIWDGRSKDAAIFDTGADATDMLALAKAERLRLTHVFLTHSHDDHVAALDQILKASKPTVWISEKEGFDRPGVKTFKGQRPFSYRFIGDQNPRHVRTLARTDYFLRHRPKLARCLRGRFSLCRVDGREHRALPGADDQRRAEDPVAASGHGNRSGTRSAVDGRPGEAPQRLFLALGDGFGFRSLCFT